MREIDHKILQDFFTHKKAIQAMQEVAADLSIEPLEVVNVVGKNLFKEDHVIIENKRELRRK